jgi:hypothetical protein
MGALTAGVLVAAGLALGASDSTGFVGVTGFADVELVDVIAFVGAALFGFASVDAAVFGFVAFPIFGGGGGGGGGADGLAGFAGSGTVASSNSSVSASHASLLLAGPTGFDGTPGWDLFESLLTRSPSTVARADGERIAQDARKWRGPRRTSFAAQFGAEIRGCRPTLMTPDQGRLPVGPHVGGLQLDRG